MHKKSNHIPVNTLPSGTREGIRMMRTSFHGPPDSNAVERPHRDNGHLFILQQKGTTHLEVDFEQHHITAPAIMYVHPDQIHRVVSFDHAEITSWIITTENLSQENVNLLNSLRPLPVLTLQTETYAVIYEMASLCIKFSERKEEKLYNAILKASFNTLVSLAASQYLSPSWSTDNYSRFEAITKAFKLALEKDYATVKSPKVYAERINISTPYLNQCVKAVTGKPVSFHIQQRVVLEAKRLLYHSTKSIKEIAADLGYMDYSYFTRLFVKTTGTTPVTFRSKIFD